MQVDRAGRGYGQQFVGQDAEGHDHEQAGVQGPEGVQETRIAQLLRLPDGYAVPQGGFLHR